MKTRFLFILILLSKFAWSQDTAKVNWIIDNKVDVLLQKKLELDQQKPSIQGFRVQLYYGGNRTEALELKSKFAQLHPDVESYLIYQQPYFRLRVGDFRSRLEAYKLMKKVEKEFPSVFIVNDEINFPK
ncbi:MAG: SPOR domain-containing protein [bacterium]|jgi:hypothetical protein